MDIDCDGNQDEPSSNANDGRCGNSGDTQSDTSFEDTVASYGESGLKNLNPYVHPYVVFGNSNDRGTSGYATFEPTKYGVEPLSLMAVVCNNQVVSTRLSHTHTPTRTHTHPHAPTHQPHGQKNSTGKKQIRSSGSGATRTATTTGPKPWWERQRSRPPLSASETP